METRSGSLRQVASESSFDVVSKIDRQEVDNALNQAALDVFKEKLVKRGVSLKALDAGEPRQSGKLYKIGATLQNGLTQEQAKKITKAIRDEGPKGVKVQVQGDEVRVSSKKKDDLQAIIATLKQQDFDFALQFVNYR